MMMYRLKAICVHGSLAVSGHSLGLHSLKCSLLLQDLILALIWPILPCLMIYILFKSIYTLYLKTPKMFCEDSSVIQVLTTHTEGTLFSSIELNIQGICNTHQ